MILELIQNYFGGIGKISKQGKDSIRYRVTSPQDLINVIWPHFEKYPLLTQKWDYFVLFKQAVDLMNRKEHLTLEGLLKIIAIKASLNLGLSTILKTTFSDIVPVLRPVVQVPQNFNPYWFAGFASGEACFIIPIIKSSSTKIGFQVQLKFKLVQHSRDEKLMRSLVEFFGCGNVYKDREIIEFIISKNKDLTSKLIPFFDKYKIWGVKA